MKKIAILYSCLLLLALNVNAQDFRKKAPAPGPAPKIEIGSYQTTRLANGLQVIVVENHKLPRVSVQLTVDIPPFMEGASAGVADLSGEMLMHGTATRTKAQLDAEVDFMGASLSSSANGLYAASLRKHTDKLMGIMADVLLNPVFPADEFEKIKKQTLSNLAQEKDDAATIAEKVGRVLNYGKAHPYGELTTEQTVGNAKLEEAKAFYQNYFKPDGSYLVIVGDIDNAKAVALANKYFTKWAPGKVPSSMVEVPALPKAQTIDFVHKSGGVQAVLNVTYPIDLKPNDPTVIPANVMTTLLGGYFRSRINDDLREKMGYTYGAGCRMSPDKYSSSFSTYGSYRNAVADSALIHLMADIEAVTKAAPSDDEVSMVKNVMSGNFARSLEEPQTVARFALNIARYGLDKNYYNNYLQNLSKVTANDVFEMAKRYIKPSQAHVVIVANKDIAERFKPFGKVNMYDTYGNLVKNAPPIPEGMNATTVINDYLTAIGGVEKLKAVNDICKKGSMAFQGMPLVAEECYKGSTKYFMKMSMNGMAVMEQKFDGTKGVNAQMGQAVPMKESEIEDMKAAAEMFPEMTLSKYGITSELKSIEEVNGVYAYKIVQTWPNGKTATYYYDMQTNLKIRSEENQSGTDMTTDYKDYRDVNGIKMPYIITLIGPFGPGVAVDIVSESIKTNSGMEDSIFEVK